MKAKANDDKDVGLSVLKIESDKLGVSLGVHKKNKAWLHSSIREVLVLRKKKTDRGGAKNNPMHYDSIGMVGSYPIIVAKLSELWLSRFDCARNAKTMLTGMPKSFENIAKNPKRCYLNLNMLPPKFLDILV